MNNKVKVRRELYQRRKNSRTRVEIVSQNKYQVERTFKILDEGFFANV